jgi:hypothetical protein
MSVINGYKPEKVLLRTGVKNDERDAPNLNSGGLVLFVYLVFSLVKPFKEAHFYFYYTE